MRCVALVTLVLAACSTRARLECRPLPPPRSVLPACPTDVRAAPIDRYLAEGVVPATDRVVAVSGLLVKSGIHCAETFCQPDCCSGCHGLLSLSGADIYRATLLDDWFCVGPNASSLSCPAAVGEQVVMTGRFVAQAATGYPPASFRPETACILSHSGITTAIPGTKFHLPMRLRVLRADGDLIVTYVAEDTMTLELDVTPGALVAARIRRDDGSESMGGVRPLAPPDDPNPVERIRNWQGGDFDRRYTFELFETTEPIVPHWTPELSGYRVLWRHDLRARLRAHDP